MMRVWMPLGRKARWVGAVFSAGLVAGLLRKPGSVVGSGVVRAVVLRAAV